MLGAPSLPGNDSMRTLLCTLIASGLIASATAQNLDGRVSKALDAENMTYTTTDSGEFQWVVEWQKEQRSQAVRVQSSTRRWQQNEMRDIYSIAYKFNASRGLPAELAMRLLNESNNSDLGFWVVQGEYVLATARVPADAKPSLIREAMNHVAELADNLELELLGTDDY